MKKILLAPIFRNLILIVSMAVGINNLQAQCTNNIIVNGSFTSVEGESVVAAGWSQFSSPDVNDAAGNLNCTVGYNWTGIPVSSTDGGTWQNLFSAESIQQTVNVIPGQLYTIDFEYAAQGIESGPDATFIQPVGVNIFINGFPSATTPADTSQYTWEKFSYTFTADITTATIFFDVYQTGYVGIDGVCIQEAISTGLEGYGSSSAIIFPNPVSTLATIKSAENLKNATLSIFDVMGNELKTIPNICGNEIKLNRDNLPGGIYFIRIVQDDRIVSTRRVVFTN